MLVGLGQSPVSVLSRLIVDNLRTVWGSLSRLQTRFPAGLAG